MAISARKISNFQQLNEISGDEFIMVAYKGKSYKLPIGLLLGNKIESIVQEINDGDGANNPITISLSDGSSKSFDLFNGKQGTQGLPGDKGPDGDPGAIVLNPINASFEDIINRLVGLSTIDTTPEEELTTKIVNGELAQYLNNSIEELREYYLTQDEFDNLGNQIDENAKYFIIEES